MDTLSLLPTEPIRGRSFDEYLEAAWHKEDGELNLIATLVCAKAKQPPEIMKLLPKQLQVYAFERMRKELLDALHGRPTKET